MTTLNLFEESCTGCRLSIAYSTNSTCLRLNVFMILSQPIWVNSVLVILISYTPVRSLRSSDKHLLVEKVGRTAKGDRAFSVAAPKLWNRLDPSIRALDNIITFKSELKTHYFVFRKAFKWCFSDFSQWLYICVDIDYG